MTLDRITDTVGRTLDVTEEELRSPTRPLRVATARSIICHLAYLCGHRGVEVARRLNISGSGVTVAAKRGKVLVKDYPELAALVG